ncbi:MAG: hypothetical protein WCK42_09025 [Myxococcaceae bacterium]
MLEKPKREFNISMELVSRILDAQINPTATMLWISMATMCTPDSPELWFKHDEFGEEFHFSRRSITKSLRLLMELGWIFDTQKRHKGRHVIYKLNWTKNARPLQTLEIPPMIEGSLFKVRPQYNAVA